MLSLLLTHDSFPLLTHDSFPPPPNFAEAPLWERALLPPTWSLHQQETLPPTTVDIKITIVFFFENGQREILLEYFQTL